MKKSDAIQKAKTLLQQMTTEEKVAQMMQVSYPDVGREEALRWASLGAGSFLHVLGDEAREVQRTAMQTRLGIPVIFGIDAIHGHGLNKNATIFPSQLAVACSWNPELVEKMGEVTAREVATDGLHWTFSPVLCLGRDTRWGRIDETFGEDSYLTGELGAAIIRGYQGEDLSDGERILACAKHYLGYGEAVGARDACDSEVTERKVREVFLPPFKKAVDAGCATIMTAYGSTDCAPLTSSRRLMHDVLRNELGFDGFVVTDWDNARSLVWNQKVAKDIEEASVLTAKAGNDMIMVTLDFYKAMLSALENKAVDISVIDEAVLHILTIKFQMELFEKPEKKGKAGCFSCDEHLAVSLEASRKSVTLLRNNGMLPLASTCKKIAVIGPNADDIRAQYGDWTYFTHPHPDPSRTPVRPYVTVKEGIEALCKENGIAFSYAKGCSVLASKDDDLDSAVASAKDADAVFYVVGDSIDLFGEYKDRADLSLSGRQTELFYHLQATGKPICTVLVSSKPLCLGDAAEKADAVLCTFNGGMFGGQAVAEAAFGKLNPSGRLPISFPRHSGQLPVYYNQLPGWHGGKYCDLPATPLFAFGEGIGYSSFEFSNLNFDKDTYTVTLDVENTGKCEGTETVQLYLNDVVSSIMTVGKRLIAFKQLTLTPGENQTVSIPISRDDFALINADCEAVVEPGDFVLMAGKSSKDEDMIKITVTL